MKHKSLLVVLPMLLALTITGCGEKKTDSAPASETTAISTPTVIAPSLSAEPSESSENNANKRLANTEAEELEKIVDSYNQEVDDSNEKARGIIDSYVEQIDPNSGK